MFDSIKDHVPRRDFLKAALAIGGAQALAACTELEVSGADESPRFPRGPEDPDVLSERQHFWDEDLLVNMAGNTVMPQHQLLIFLDYRGAFPPSESDRETVETALRTIERAYQRGTGGDVGAQINEGLLFMIAYSRTYFDQFDEPFPEEIGLQRPEAVLEAVGEDPSKADHYDAVMLLNGDFASMLLEVEQALFGEGETVNGLPVEARLSDVFERVERRTGFIGPGVPREEIADPVADRIDENAPLSMGFESGFRDNLPDNDRVAFHEEPFKDGTTFLVSRLGIDLERWYDNTHEDRIELMFSTEHSEAEVGQVGERLGADSGITEEIVDSRHERAAEHGRIGHSTKTATARDDSFEPTIHRRSEAVATDLIREGVVGFNFSSIQADTQRFVEVREAMNVDAHDVDVPDEEHGIIDYLETLNRATFLVPPRSQRALPSPQPEVDAVE